MVIVLKSKKPLLVIIAIILLLIILAANMSFNKSLKEHIQQNTATRLQEIVLPNMVSFDLQMQEQIKKVKTLAAVVGQQERLNSAATVDILQATVAENGLLRCAVAFPDGSFITHDGKNEGNVSQETFFQASMAGEFFISDPRPAVVDPTKTVMLFVCPIQKDDEIIGSIIYSYLCDDMDKIFNLHFLNEDGHIMIVKQDGTTLIGSSPYSAEDTNNVLVAMREQCSHARHPRVSCLALTQESGSFDVVLPDLSSPLLVIYSKLSYNDWYMVSMVTQTAANQTISDITAGQRNMGIVIAVCVAVYIVLLVFLWMFQQNNVDKMTGALTLTSFTRQAKRILRRHNYERYMVVKLDIKNFKLINRIYDFTVGDKVIKCMGEALRFALNNNSSSIFARTVVDNFVILLPYYERNSLNDQRELFINKFRELMGPEFTTAVEFPTGQYVISDADYPRPDVGEILEKANFAHRASKQHSRTVVVDYVEDLEKEAIFEKKVEDKMATSLTNNDFKLYLQPKFRTDTEEICGAEALVRWAVDGQIFMHPMDFIPVLERNGFIVKIDKYMFSHAVQKIRSFMDAGLEPIPISVNFSRCHLSNENFVQELCEIADSYGVPHKYLEIELTESAVYEHVGRMIELTEQLHEAGFTLSMDDFGTGYSSLSLVKDLDIDVIKVDKSFFDHCTDTKRARIIIQHIFGIAQELGITTVAEGIEYKEQVAMLKELGCDIIQGFYFSKPIPADELNLFKN